MSMDYFLTSRRLGFRCWREDDLPLAMELWGDPETTVFTGGPFTPETVHARLADEILRMKERGIQYWPVFLLDDDSHVGCAGLRTRHAYRHPEERRASIEFRALSSAKFHPPGAHAHLPA